MAAGALAHGHDPNLIGLDAVHDGPAPKRIVTGYGFWLFLLSDMVMFSCFFAAYAVLLGQTAGGPSGAQLFNLRNVAVETGCLLASSFTCGMASIAAEVHSHLCSRPRIPFHRIPRIRRSCRARRRSLA
jgi:cytochrome o ubiquinol oxidase subunit 3